MASREERIAELKRKLSVRDSKPGFQQNCEELRKEIARLEAENL